MCDEQRPSLSLFGRLPSTVHEPASWFFEGLPLSLYITCSLTKAAPITLRYSALLVTGSHQPRQLNTTIEIGQHIIRWVNMTHIWLEPTTGYTMTANVFSGCRCSNNEESTKRERSLMLRSLSRRRTRSCDPGIVCGLFQRSPMSQLGWRTMLHIPWNTGVFLLSSSPQYLEYRLPTILGTTKHVADVGYREHLVSWVSVEYPPASTER